MGNAVTHSHFDADAAAPRYRAAILIASDRAAAGVYPDKTGGPLTERLIEYGYDVVECRVVPDELPALTQALRELCNKAEYVVTSGGTGPAPRDVIPEATRAVLERELPGVAEMLRARSLQKTIHAVGSRGLCGLRGKTLILNAPGAPAAALEYVEWLEPAVKHILRQAAGK